MLSKYLLLSKKDTTVPHYSVRINPAASSVFIGTDGGNLVRQLCINQKHFQTLRNDLPL